MVGQWLAHAPSIKRLFAIIVGVFSICFSVMAVDLKADAPTRYVVQKNDTLWDIAGKYLDKPWLWPQLWRNNSYLNNPHLIYPGDIIVIRYVDNQPVLEIQRDKKKRVLTPNQKVVTKPQPINVLPWTLLAPYLLNHQIMDEESFDLLPYVLGDHRGYLQYVSDNVVLSKQQGRPKGQYTLLRKRHTIKNMSGEVLGVQVNHIATASIIEDALEGQWLLQVVNSVEEAKRGDKLIPSEDIAPFDMQLSPAETQRGHIIGNLNDRMLLSKFDVVILDLGQDDVQTGTVMGIYSQGPDIIDGQMPSYEYESNVLRSAFSDGEPLKQPALKIGEVVVIKTFRAASYGLIMRANDLVKTGAIVAHP